MSSSKPEEIARQRIDKQLNAAGWMVQELKDLNLGASKGIAVCAFPLKSQKAADYVLFVDRQAVGVVEAKKVGETLSGVAEQTARYVTKFPENLPRVQEPLPFAYETTGIETYFRNTHDPDTRSRRIFSFHRPETLLSRASQEDTLRGRLQNMPVLNTEGLWDCQIEAITNLERSLKEARPRALIQMATGSGKTYTAVSSIYRLIKHAGAKRILFLVDRNNLGRQTRKEFQQYETPDDGRKFTELYNVQHMQSNVPDPVSKVCITTIQRLYSMLRGEEEFDESLEEQSLFDVASKDEKPKEVVYNPQIPIEYFDFIVTDECHRSIYNVWRQVLEYFDAFLIGLTATPSKQTLGFFNQNLVTEYPHERAVADGVNVGYDIYRIQTKITEHGSKVHAGYYVDKRDRLTRQTRWEQLDEDFEYDPKKLDRAVVAPDQIRTVIKTFRDRLFTEIFPGRTWIPKTLVFAKDDSHAEDIVHIIREEFGKGNEFCKKITYKTTGAKPEDLIQSFRNSPNPRIAVTVDMISTGTDIRPLECLLFMRDVKSRIYFDQMKGRGTRTIKSDDLRAITADARTKDHFVIVDAVGVTESDKTDTRPLERKPAVSFEKLLMSIAMGNKDDDSLSSLASRLARLDRDLDSKAQNEIKEAAGQSLRIIVNRLLDAVDPDIHAERAMTDFSTNSPSPEQLAEAEKNLKNEACITFDEPKVRNKILDIKKRSEQIIDTVSTDNVVFAGPSDAARERAKSMVNTFKQFMEDNEDELTALQIIYNKPYGQRHFTYDGIKQLAEAIGKPPYNLTPELLWKAYEQLEQAKVKGAGPQKLLTDIISLLRFTIGDSDVLEPYTESVNERFQNWLADQEATGRTFTSEQMEWLEMIKGHIATSLAVDIDDFEFTPFHDKGGAVKAHQIFGDGLTSILQELNEVLVA